MDSGPDLGPKKNFFFGRKKIFFCFSDVLGSFFCVFPKNRSSEIFTFEEISGRRLFFCVFALSLIGNMMSYTGLGSGF